MSDMNIMAGLGVAVREFQLTTGEADYGLYIDGKVAGVIELTATPTKQTLGFFNQNLVAEYDHKAAVADNVNVGFDDAQCTRKHLDALGHTILTKITVQGAQLENAPMMNSNQMNRLLSDSYSTQESH